MLVYYPGENGRRIRFEGREFLPVTGELLAEALSLIHISSLDQDPSDLDAVSDADGAQAAADTGAGQGQLALPLY